MDVARRKQLYLSISVYGPPHDEQGNDIKWCPRSGTRQSRDDEQVTPHPRKSESVTYEKRLSSSNAYLRQSQGNHPGRKPTTRLRHHLRLCRGFHPWVRQWYVADRSMWLQLLTRTVPWIAWWGGVLGNPYFNRIFGELRVIDGKESYSLTATQQATGTAVGQAGVAIGCLAGGWFTDKFGRKNNFYWVKNSRHRCALDKAQLPVAVDASPLGSPSLAVSFSLPRASTVGDTGSWLPVSSLSASRLDYPPRVSLCTWQSARQRASEGERVPFIRSHSRLTFAPIARRSPCSMLCKPLARFAPF